MKQADHCFANGDYELSAVYYAMTKASFEEIALKFVQVEKSSHPLKTFLMKVRFIFLLVFKSTSVFDTFYSINLLHLFLHAFIENGDYEVK